MKFTETIPDHLKSYIVEQDYSLYNAIDHAAWRYILRVSKKFFSTQAHQKYCDGLAETGIGTEEIPKISEMDEKLKRFGWRAVAVSGFIPPAAFMEFQALGILPIACDMRTLDHIAYTPAPDIVHEAAGHAPIIADAEYAEYLKKYGEISRKAIFSKRDMELYEAIRRLSEIKEDPLSTSKDIEDAQRHLIQVSSSIDYTSEATYLSRMYWWTVEYGLIGDPSKPKIYGAGLLSSVGESYHCLSPHVAKIPFTLDCINRSYDITRPQPQLFVSPDFHTLTNILIDYSRSMAFKVGGLEALSKALQSEALTTTTLDSGVQISGVLSQIAVNTENQTQDHQAYFLKYSGPVQICFNDSELLGQGVDRHTHGYSSPIGVLADGKSLSEMSVQEIRSLNKIIYKSGVTVTGKITDIVQKNGKVILITIENCLVKQNDQVLYQPEWGPFDLACGSVVTSVCGGSADFKNYYRNNKPEKSALKQKTNTTNENKELVELYDQVRKIRNGVLSDSDSRANNIITKLNQSYANDWLLRLELLELILLKKISSEKSDSLHASLSKIQCLSKSHQELIKRGLEILQK